MWIIYYDTVHIGCPITQYKVYDYCILVTFRVLGSDEERNREEKGKENREGKDKGTWETENRGRETTSQRAEKARFENPYTRDSERSTSQSD